MRNLTSTGAPPGAPATRVEVAGTKSRTIFLCLRGAGGVEADGAGASGGLGAGGGPKRCEKKSAKPPCAAAGGPAASRQTHSLAASRKQRNAALRSKCIADRPKRAQF